MQGLNLSKFKKTAEDKKTVTLTHPEDGHTITILKSKLPHLHRKALEKLPIHEMGKEAKEPKKYDEGGDVSASSEASNPASGANDPSVARAKAAKEFKFPRTVPADKPAPASGTLEEISKVFHADGGEVEDTDSAPTGTGGRQGGSHGTQKKQGANSAGVLSDWLGLNNEAEGGQIKKYAEGTPDNTVEPPKDESQDSSKMDTPASGNPININIGAPAQTAAQPVGTNSVLMPGKTGAPPTAVQPPAQTPQTVQTPQAGTSLENEAQNTMGAIAQQRLSGKEQQAIDAAKGAAAATTQQAYLDKRQELAAQDAQNIQELKNHTDDYKQYINEHPIEAQRYINNMGDGEKIGNAIGLLLGGFGGMNNPAMAYLNRQVDNDIAAQKENAANQKNVWAAYENLYGNQNIATNLAKVSANDILVHQAALTAAKLGTQQAQANFDAFSSAKELENTQLRYQSGSILNGMNNGTIPKETKPQDSSKPTAVEPLSQSEKKAGMTLHQKSEGYTVDEDGGIRSPSEGAKSSTKHDEFVAVAPTPILHAGHSKMFPTLQYNPTVAAQMPELTRQYNGAVQADKALSNISNTFNAMSKETSLKQRMTGAIPHALGAIGTAIGAKFGGPKGAAVGGGAGEVAGTAAASGALSSESERRFNSDLSQLEGYLSAALPGRGDIFLDKQVKSNIPVYGDGPDTLKKKYEALSEYIKAHTDTSLLDVAHLTNK